MLCSPARCSLGRLVARVATGELGARAERATQARAQCPNSVNADARPTCGAGYCRFVSAVSRLTTMPSVPGPPSLANYRMPAEWEPHLATYLVWPHNLDTWPSKFEAIPPVFARIAATLAQFEAVRILVRDQICRWTRHHHRRWLERVCAGRSRSVVRSQAGPTRSAGNGR